MLEIINLSCKIDEKEILKKISFSCKKNTIVAMMGASGSGKTTMLRCLAGLQNFEPGVIKFEGNNINDLADFKTGMVFQGFNLFPHLNVLKNLTFAPLNLKIRSKAETYEMAHKLLEDFGLLDKSKCYPNELSGGQKQRVAIARTMMMEPKVLLFDEPTSALDPELVGEVAQIIGKIKSPDKVIIVVTHEVRLANLCADRVLFFDNGSIIDDKATQDFFKGGNAISTRAQKFLQGVL
jgi:polar amino acid transport system ATP-binding protein